MVVWFAPSNNSNDKNGIDIYRISDAMKARGWSLNSLQHPPSLHVCVTLALAPRAKDFLKDLEDSVATVRKEGESDSKKGTAGMYGMAGSIPDGPVNDFLSASVDLMLTA
jgi:sphinganine-1-phosphate aldolase